MASTAPPCNQGQKVTPGQLASLWTHCQERRGLSWGSCPKVVGNIHLALWTSASSLL